MQAIRATQRATRSPWWGHRSYNLKKKEENLGWHICHPKTTPKILGGMSCHPKPPWKTLWIFRFFDKALARTKCTGGTENGWGINSRCSKQPNSCMCQMQMPVFKSSGFTPFLAGQLGDTVHVSSILALEPRRCNICDHLPRHLFHRRFRFYIDL